MNVQPAPDMSGRGEGAPGLDDDQFLDVAGAILDGVSIDWTVLGRATSGGERPFVDQLWALGRIADVHRRAADETPANWGPFEIVERIGSGTFGDVFRAVDPSLDRSVALKLLRSPAAGRHVAEGRLLARVRHPNVVTVHGAATHDGVDGIWMEFVNGRTLAQTLGETGRFSAADVAAIGIDLCRALGAVHASGLLHGDIKAQNVMREDNAAGGRIVLMDFGTSRIAADDARAAGLAGTPLYVAPEVLAGGAPDPAADVYAVGVTLYLLVTGTFPVEGKTLREIRAAHERRARSTVRAKRPDVPKRIASVIDRAIAPRADRFASAADFGAALASAVQPRAVRPLAAAALALTVVGAGAAWRMGTPHVRPEQLRVQLTDSAVVAMDPDGRRVWQHPAPAGYHFSPPIEPAPRVVAGAHPAVYVLSAGRSKPTDEVGGELMAFSIDGALERTFAFDDAVTIGGTPYGPPWGMTSFAVTESGGSRRLAVAAHHLQWSASMVTILDEQFRRRGTYVQSGWIESVNWVSPSRLIVGGYNNAHEGGTLVLLDVDRLEESYAQAPEPSGSPHFCSSCGTAAPLRSVVMRRTEVNQATGSPFNRAVVQAYPDRIIARTVEASPTGQLVVDALYEFGADLTLRRASFGGRYWDVHQALFMQGSLRHDRDHCPDREGPAGILRWDPAEGWRTVAIDHRETPEGR